MMIIINQEQGNPKSEVASKNDAKLADTTRVTPYDRNSKQKNWNNHMLAATSKPQANSPCEILQLPGLYVKLQTQILKIY